MGKRKVLPEGMDDGAGLGLVPLDLRPGQEDVEYTLAATELGFEVAVAEKLEERGIYDTTRLKQRKPEIYQAVRKCAQSGVRAKVIAHLLSLDIRTVNAVVAEMEAEGSITPYKERTVWALRGVVTLAIDELTEQAAAGKLSAIDVAVLIDKIELLSGGVTHRVEHKMTADEEESVRFFTEARRKLEGASGMVFEAEVLGETGERDLARLADGVQTDTFDRKGDSESSV